MRLSRSALLLLGGPLACTPENTVQGHDKPQEYAARLSLDPVALDFGALDAGDSATLSFTMSNIGDATLYVDPPEVDGSGAFTLLDADEEIALAPGEDREIDVVYVSQREDDVGTIRVESSDPVEPEQVVDLAGAGLFPSLVLSPSPYDLGTHLTGCEPIQGELTLTNAGGGRAEVSGITLLGGVFSVIDPPGLPLTLASGEAITLDVQADPSEDGDWSGTLVVTSDDPAGERRAELGATTETWSQEDKFKQGTWAMTDVLLTVDRSGSMDDDAARLSTELPTFFAALEDIGTDYQLAVVTEDDGCANEALFSPSTDDAEALFAEAVFGRGGTWTEAGFTLARSALQQTGDGDCNEGFLRDGARVSIVHLSDEPEQSSRSWESMVDDLLSLAPTATVSAVAGPMPSGCATAEAGRGYYEAAEATGGFFADFCDTDWTEVASSLAALSVSEITDTFPLSELPWPETLSVTLDGEDARGWTYDADQNAIVFDTPPEDGTTILVNYDYGVCD